MDIEPLYHAIAPRLTAYLVANGTDYAAACDIVRATFLRIWGMRDDFVLDRSQISGLAYLVARNLRADRSSKAGRETPVDKIWEGDVPAFGPGEASANLAYLRRRVCAALEQLPDSLRETYTLFQLQRLSVREIAIWTDTPESLVKARICSAKRKLRPLLQDLWQAAVR